MPSIRRIAVAGVRRDPPRKPPDVMLPRPRLSHATALFVLGASFGITVSCINFATSPCQECEPDDKQCIAEKCDGTGSDTGTTTEDMTTTTTTTTSTTTMTTLTTTTTTTTTTMTSTTEDPTTTTTTGGPECDEDLMCDENEGEDIAGCLHDCAICTPTGTCTASKETPYSCPEDCPATGCDHDGMIDALSEQCDDGNMVDEDGCTNACAINVCGDGVLYPEGAGGTEECDDGNAEAGDGCSPGCKFEAKIIFVTSSEHVGNLGGLAGADAICQMRADSAGLSMNGKTFKAWLSDGSISAADRLTTLVGFKGPFTLVNGEKVAQGWDGLKSGTLEHAINLDETMKSPSSQTVWTNTNPDGGVVGMAHCMSWSSASMAESGGIGSAAATGGDWTTVGALFCSASSRLYCVQG
ncbi:MAG: DUF4215 domain-containing protein [Nannocystaceae bacterium]